MNKFKNLPFRINFWLNNSRLFSLPMTFMSWIIVFVYALKEGGNIFNGIFALIGISFAHLATNLFDDYVDYKRLSVSDEFMKSTVKTKCAYIKSGEATLDELLAVVIIYCSIAALYGLYLLINCGINVLWLGLVGAVFVLFYSKLSSAALSEFAVGTAFGPLLFEGVYFVMSGSFSFEIFLISIVSGIFTTVLLYVHTFLDYDGDVISHKKTLCVKIGEKYGRNFALNVLPTMCAVGYLVLILLAFLYHKIFYLIPFLSIPYLFIVYFGLKKYMEDKTFTPKARWWNYPLDNWNEIKNTPTAPFYFNLFGARNLAMWSQTLLCISVLLK
ncbi:prenyltransferase [bacterium]|nr:prenyltransferase [bacterium]